MWSKILINNPAKSLLLSYFIIFFQTLSFNIVATFLPYFSHLTISLYYYINFIIVISESIKRNKKFHYKYQYPKIPLLIPRNQFHNNEPCQFMKKLSIVTG